MPDHLALAKTRVCHVSLGLTTGGLERLLVDFARFHDQNRFELHFVALDTLGRPADEIRAAGCSVYRLEGGRGRCRRFSALTRLFQDLQPGIVHTHNAAPHWIGTLAARWAGVPFVVNTRHGQRFRQTCKDRWQYWLAGQLADRIVAVSDDAAWLTVDEDGLSPRRVRRIWNGIDIQRFAPRAAGPRPPVAISVARLSHEKDFPTLLRAVALARRDVPELRLQLVGDGPERAALFQLTRDLRLEDAVEFLGERRDVPELLAQAGFFVSSSLSEGISLTLLEAMAVGLPVVATAVGGNPEIIQEGVTGRLVPSADPERLAAALVATVQHPTEWPALGAAGRRRVEEHFDVEQMIQKYEHLYGELLKTRRRVARPKPHPEPVAERA